MSLEKTANKEQLIFFREAALTLKIFGLWQDCDLDMHKRNTVGGFLVIVIGFGITISIFSGYLDLKVKGDFFGSQMALNLALGVLLCTTKIYTMWNSVAEIKLCFKWLQQFSRRFENQRFIRNAILKYRIFFYVGMIFITFGVFVFLSIPVMESTRVLPLPVTNHIQILDLLQGPVYQIVYLYQGVCTLLIGYYVVACDTMFCGIMMLIAAFLESINMFFVETFAEHNMSDEQKEKAMIKVMEDFIETTRIIDFVRRILSLVSFSNFLMNVSYIGFASYMLFLLPFNSIMFWYMVIANVFNLLQLGIYCFFGEAIVTQTQKLRYNIYQCDWYNQTKSFKLMVLLTLQRTQNEPYFTAGKLVPLSNNTFAEILKMASSFCMFLFNIKRRFRSGME